MTTVYCIGRNYQEHAKELGNTPVAASENPLVFLKSENSLRGLSPSRMAFAGELFHHEVELVYRLGKDIDLNTEGPLVSFLDALTLGLDLTRREEQSRLKNNGHPWTTAKSFLGSAVIADWIPMSGEINLEALEFSLTVNDDIRQRGTSSDMTFSIEHLLRYLASWNQLRKGDLVFTGTPAGVGPIKVGDRFQLKLEGYGTWNGVL